MNIKQRVYETWIWRKENGELKLIGEVEGGYKKNIDATTIDPVTMGRINALAEFVPKGRSMTVSEILLNPENEISLGVFAAANEPQQTPGHHKGDFLTRDERARLRKLLETLPPTLKENEG